MVCNVGLFPGNQSSIPPAPSKIVGPNEMVYRKFIIYKKIFPDYSPDKAKKLLDATYQSDIDTWPEKLRFQLSDFNSSLWLEKLRSICHQFDEHSLKFQVEMRRVQCITLLKTPLLNDKDKNALERAMRELDNFNVYLFPEQCKPPLPLAAKFFLELDDTIYDIVSAAL